jgi:hypothetical protein
MIPITHCESHLLLIVLVKVRRVIMNDKGSSVTIRIEVVRVAVIPVGTILIDGEVVKVA